MAQNASASIDLTIRQINGADEMRAAEELQKVVWGLPDLDVVPLTQLVAAVASGGFLLGAFDGSELVGFVYGFAGFEHGEATHHSHMLAVRHEYRNFGVGYRLKLAQRDLVMEQGIGEMTWTFDPLQSLNAWFNFHRLGVVSNRYLPDFYGTDPASFLHQNGTDRLWVTWPLKTERVREHIDRRTPEPILEGAVKLVACGPSNGPDAIDTGNEIRAGRVVIEIPFDIIAIEKEDRETAVLWRQATRKAFTTAFAAGFIVTDFVRGIRAGSYLLERSSVQLELAKFGLVDL